MHTRPGRFLVALLGYVITSTVAFGVALGVWAFVTGAPTSPTPVERFNWHLGVNMGLYGAFHWALLGTVSFPVFVVPVIVQALVLRPRAGVGIRAVAPGSVICLLAASAVVVRTTLLEYPSLRSHPAEFLFGLISGYRACEFVAFLSGLFCAYCATTWLTRPCSRPA